MWFCKQKDTEDPPLKQGLRTPGSRWDLFGGVSAVLMAVSLFRVSFPISCHWPWLTTDLENRWAGKGKGSFHWAQPLVCTWWSWPRGCLRCPALGLAGERAECHHQSMVSSPVPLSVHWEQVQTHHGSLIYPQPGWAKEPGGFIFLDLFIFFSHPTRRITSSQIYNTTIIFST